MNAKVRVDMTETEVTRALGTAYSGRGSPGEAMDYVYSGSDADLGVMARNGRVTAVVRMPHWQPDPRQNYAQQSNAMRSKARVGMSLGQVWAAIGRPSQVLSSATDDSRRQVLSYGFCRVHLENDRVVAVD